MPLPSNGSISLQGHSRPGEATTMPKIAMVVRMTEDALDALQNLSAADRIDFEFGDKPGIYVRDQLFSMHYDKERENQELFIRTTLPNRRNAALRLNANVVGKFAVEQVLSDKISQRIHNVTAAAAKQKANKKAILVDTPPVTPPATQTSATTKKGPPKNTAKSTPTIVKSYATAPSSQAATVTSASASLPKDLATMYRQRLIHYLALGSASVPDIFKEFGGSEIDHNTRAGIMDILIEIAEQEQLPRKAASTVTNWRLKPQTWLEVRPYQYSGYTDNVRTKVARTARQYLSSLKIPENDPAWDHVKFRDSSHGGTASNSQAAQRAINGTSTAAAKAKAQKAKDSKSKATVAKIKTESVPRPSNALSSLPAQTNPFAERSGISMRNTKGKERETDSEKEEGELSAPQSPAQVSTVPADRHSSKSRSNGATTPLMPPPPVPVSSQSPSQPSLSSKRSATVDPRRRPQPDPTQRPRATPPLTSPASASADRKPVVVVKKEMEVTKKERASLPQGGKRTNTSNSTQSVKEKKERERESDRESIRSVKKERGRESDRESLRGHDREKLAKASDYPKERDLERPKGKKVKGQATSRPAPKATTKRKTSESSDDESSDWGYENERFFQKSATSKVKRERDAISMKSSSSSLKVPKRGTSPSPKQKMKREVSPLDPPKTKPSMGRKIVSSTSAPQMVKKEPKVDSLTRSLTTKERKRRRSIDFTSSSEEEEVKPKVKAPKATKTGSSLVTKNALHAKSRSTGSTKEDLRLRYSTVYAEYLSAFQKLVTQQAKVRKVATILGRDSESLSGDSDVDVDMMPLDELEELTKRHQQLYDELEEIKRKYTS